MRNDVEGDALGELLRLDRISDEDGAGLGEELVHAFLAGAGHGLVGRNHHALDLGDVVQRLQRHDQLCRRAIRVGDDVALLEVHDRIRVHFRNDQRNVGVVAPGRRVVDDDATLGTDLRRPLLGNRAAGGHQADVGVGEIVVFEVLDLQNAVTEGDLGALRARRGERDDLRGRKTTLGEDVEHFATDIAGGAYNCNLETHVYALFLSLRGW